MILDPIKEPTMEVEESNSDLDIVRERILDTVAKSDGFFKSQQIGENDLTISEKRKIASDTLSQNIPLFIERYWKYIRSEDVQYFEQSDHYSVKFYVAEIHKLHNSKKWKTSVKNRRYEAMKKMVKEGSYFSEEEMRKRNPFLYDQLIGQHLTENERINAYRKQHENETFSTFLIGQIERNVENCLFKEQEELEEVIEEEEDDDDENDNGVASDESELEEEPKKTPVTESEKALLRSEFANIMYESFIDGKDKEFDYSSVDNNVEYDSVQQRDLDEQEKYFDEDSME